LLDRGNKISKIKQQQSRRRWPSRFYIFSPNEVGIYGRTSTEKKLEGALVEADYDAALAKKGSVRLNEDGYVNKGWPKKKLVIPQKGDGLRKLVHIVVRGATTKRPWKRSCAP